MSANEPSVEEIIASLDADKQRQIKRIIYGNTPGEIEIPQAVKQAAAAADFEVQGWKMAAGAQWQTRAPRTVRVAISQNAIVKPTTAPVAEQRQAIFDRLRQIIDAAGACGVNVLCLQECWTTPFFMCTREKMPWCEFAEEAHRGPTFDFCSEMAKKWNMVIVSPILERDEAHLGTLWNTAVIISNNGGYIGKTRKVHIPRTGDFNESTYYVESPEEEGFPVFETAFGKIGVPICYSRHFPQSWEGFAKNGAEILFNPCATVAGLSEPMWHIEGRNAAIANSVFVGSNNRVGTETFANAFTSGDGKAAHNDFGHFYGSSYIANPDGTRTPGLSRNRDGVLFQEVDLNTIQAVRDKWNFNMAARPHLYRDFYKKYCAQDFVPQIITDPSLKSNNNATSAASSAK